MKTPILLVSMLLLSASVHPQTRNKIEPLPKLLSVREQQAVRESWLKKRLDTMLAADDAATEDRDVDRDQ